MRRITMQKLEDFAEEIKIYCVITNVHLLEGDIRESFHGPLLPYELVFNAFTFDISQRPDATEGHLTCRASLNYKVGCRDTGLM